jgi:hypothetical protein
MYAYAHRSDEAKRHVDHVLENAARQGGFPADWRSLEPNPEPWRNATGPRRLYLYSLKALGFVLLRKGEVEEARAALDKLRTLDPDDQVGSSVVLGMAERLLEDEEELV